MGNVVDRRGLWPKLDSITVLVLRVTPQCELGQSHLRCEGEAGWPNGRPELTRRRATNDVRLRGIATVCEPE